MAALDPYYSDQIIGFEGYAPKASWDYQQYSNGYGTKALYPGEQIDKETARQRFDTEVGKAAEYVDKVIPPDTPPGARAALISLTYNAGPGWTSSGLGDAVKAGDWNTAQQKFVQYNKAGGEVNPGLVNRRNAEVGWFNQATPLGAPTNVASLPPVSAPISGPPPLSAGQPLQPQPLNLARQQFQIPASAQAAPQQAPQQQLMAPPLAGPTPLNMPQINKQLLLARLQNIPLPPGFRGFNIG